jgi:hypothetical protein
MVDPLFTALARQKSKERKEPRKNPDSTSIAIMHMTEYMRINGFDKYALIGEDEEDRYIELISAIFIDYLNDNKNTIDGFEFDTPAFAQIPEFQVNPKFIKNSVALNLIKSKQLFHDIFKVLLGTFKKERKRATGVIDKSMMKEINEVIFTIQDKIKEKQTFESDQPMSFSEFLKRNS